MYLYCNKIPKLACTLVSWRKPSERGLLRKFNTTSQSQTFNAESECWYSRTKRGWSQHSDSTLKSVIFDVVLLSPNWVPGQLTIYIYRTLQPGDHVLIFQVDSLARVLQCCSCKAMGITIIKVVHHNCQATAFMLNQGLTKISMVIPVADNPSSSTPTQEEEDIWTWL